MLQASKILSKEVLVSRSKKVEYCLFKITRLGYVNSFTILNFKFVEVFLKYVNGEAVIRGFFLVSKFSLQQFVKCKDIIKVLRDNFFALTGFLMLNTSKGPMLDVEGSLFKIGGSMDYIFY